MPLDYTALLQSHQNEQRETIRNTKETSNWLLDSSEIPHSTNVHGFIETKLSPLELEITNSSVPELLRNLQIFKWKSRTVLLAFLHRAILAQQLVNPVAEFYIEESLKRADDLDKYYETHGKPIGELHGLPVSIKEEFDLLGQRTTLSLINQHDSEVSKQTSPNLEPLIQQGANIFLKTNVPIGAFNIVTHNNLYGITSNPYNTNFTAGGSSGGEAALLALRGSPLGVGADLGGSIRQPSSFNGLFGIKPSSGRVPHNNSKIVVRGMESLKGTNGALANDIDALSIYLKSIIDSEPWLRDTNVVPLPWDEKKAKGKIGRTLKFAVLLDDGLIRPTPAVERALQLVKLKLIAKGHEVIEWDIKEHYDLFRIAKFAPIFMNSGGLRNLREEISATSEADLKDFEADDLKVSNLWDLQLERTTKLNEFWLKWQELGIDGLISPVTALSGCRPEDFYDFTYSPFANVIDFPSVAFPVTTVDRAVDLKREVHARNWEEGKVWSNYDPEESHGVPIGLQVIGAKLQEEFTVELARVIVDSLSTKDLI